MNFMVTKEEAKKRVNQLVNEFKDISKSHLDSMPEEDIKRIFITPLLEALGWNKFDIESESRVLRGRADYLLKLGNTGVLVVEAKKTNVNLSEDEGRQAVSYAYHSKIKFAVLTNFKHLRVFHALSNIKNIDNNLLKIENNPFRLSYEEYVDKFDYLWLLSKESFENGEINKLLSSKDLRINKPIDKRLLDDLLKIREWLSKDLKSKKMSLTDPQIDEIIQVFIDRLIFMRSVEDRGLEGSGFLLGLDSDVRNQRVQLQLFPYLIEKFKEFNNKYDSRLFESGLLEKEGAFSNEALHKVIRALYFGIEDSQSKYMFNEIPGDIFGNIYEQYLGTILAGTSKRVKLDKESGKRKKMGIYYTPSYIVDYIVKNTVGEYIKDKSIDEILEVRILDPACGSGSFLTRAFQEVCNILLEKLNKGEEGSKTLFKKPRQELKELNLGQKIEVLRNCIYGVDLDEKAVELARLNLMLKVLESEGHETKSAKLPHLSNIRCGNSLIDEPRIAGDKAFNWQAQFPEVFSKGGFDVVVGNPPYIRNTELDNKDKTYFIKNYKGAYKQYDIYLLFFEKGLNLLKNNGFLGFITPNKFMVSDYAINLRNILLKESKISLILDVSDIIVFEDASTYPAITIIKKEVDKDKINNKIRYNKILNEKELNLNKFTEVPQERFIESKDNRLLFDNDNSKSLLIKKIEKDSKRIKELFLCQRGSPKNKIKILENNKKNSLPCIISKDVNRFYYSVYSKFILSTLQNKLLKKEKILLPRTVLSLKAAFDEGNHFIMDRIYFLIAKDTQTNLKVICALLNARLIDFYYKYNFGTTHVGGGYLDLRGTQIMDIPIKLPSKAQEQKFVDLVTQMLTLQQKYHSPKCIGGEKERLEQQIKQTDYMIDEEVYKLYGITDEEKKVIEESLK